MLIFSPNPLICLASSFFLAWQGKKQSVWITYRKTYISIYMGNENQQSYFIAWRPQKNDKGDNYIIISSIKTKLFFPPLPYLNNTVLDMMKRDCC